MATQSMTKILEANDTTIYGMIDQYGESKFICTIFSRRNDGVPNRILYENEKKTLTKAQNEVMSIGTAIRCAIEQTRASQYIQMETPEEPFGYWETQEFVEIDVNSNPEEAMQNLADLVDECNGGCNG